MKRLLLLLVISVVSQIAVAQWRFTVSMSISGCGNSLEDKAAIKAAEAQVNYWMGQGFVTFHSKIECEQSRNFIISESYTNGNCKVRFIPTPCTGSGGASDVVDVMGISRGTSFNPTNVASEIQDWSEDDMQRMIVLNPDYNNIEPNQLSMGSKEIDQVRDQARKSAFILDTSKPFRSLNIGEDTGIITHSDDLLPLKEKPANMAIVNKYLDKIDIDNIPDFSSVDDYVQWLKDKFREVSGYDIDLIVNKKSELTDEEKQALANYREFISSKKVCDGLDMMMAKSEETKVFEMVFLSAFSYGDLDKKALEQTNYKLVDLNDGFIKNDNMSEFLKIVNMLNQNPGFHVDLFYNEKTQEYATAFRGSSMSFDALVKSEKTSELVDLISDWMKTNKVSGLNEDVPFQYQLAAFLGQKLPKDINMTFTGHSLGGALASIAAAVSGKPAYTFNSEGVNNKTLEKYGLDNIGRENFSKIKAFYASNDLLSSTQDLVGNDTNDELAARALGTRINIGQLTVWGDYKPDNKKNSVNMVKDVIFDNHVKSNVEVVKLYKDGVIDGYSAIGLTTNSSIIRAPIMPIVITEGATRGLAHRVVPMVNHFSNLREQKFHVSSYFNECSKASMRTLQSIQIIME